MQHRLLSIGLTASYVPLMKLITDAYRAFAVPQEFDGDRIASVVLTCDASFTIKDKVSAAEKVLAITVDHEFPAQNVIKDWEIKSGGVQTLKVQIYEYEPTIP